MGRSTDDNDRSAGFGGSGRSSGKGSGWPDLLHRLMLLALDALQWRMAAQALQAHAQLQSRMRDALNALITFALAAVLLAVGLICLMAAWVLWLDDAWRVPALAAVAVLLLAVGAALMGMLRRRVLRQTANALRPPV